MKRRRIPASKKHCPRAWRKKNRGTPVKGVFQKKKWEMLVARTKRRKKLKYTVLTSPLSKAMSF
jgi:hypothetical protein